MIKPETTPTKWGQGPPGYGWRCGNYFATNIIGASFESGFALPLGEDNRYFASGSHHVGRRLAYAATSPLLARHSNGSRWVSISALAGVTGAAFIRQIWQPPGASHIGNVGRTIGLTFAFGAGLDVIRGFAPHAIGAAVR